jgi:hypothetical protein
MLSGTVAFTPLPQRTALVEVVHWLFEAFE